MPKSASVTRTPVRLLAVMLGVLLLAHLVQRAGPAKLMEGIVAVGWGLAWVFALAGLSHVAKTWAWRIILLDEKRHVSFPRMLGLRLASEAVGQLGALGQLFGEGLRVSLLDSAVPAANRIASVTVDRALFILSAALVTTTGMLAVLISLPLPHRVALYGKIAIFILVGVLLVAAVAVRRRWNVFSGPARVLGRIGPVSGWIERRRSLIESVEQTLLNFYHHTPGAFWGSFALNLACHALAVGEVYLTLRLMGIPVSAFECLAVEALTKLVNIMGVFNPGNLGTYEGGNMLIAKMFGLSAAAGLTLSMIRRVRALFWGAAGALCLTALSKAKSRGASSPEPERKSGVTGLSHVAVILANGLKSPVPRVGTLPVVLRSILSAHKAGAARIVIVLDHVDGPGIMRELVATHRLPAAIEWYQTGDTNPSIPFILGKVTGDDDYVALIAADRTYHPSLHRRAGEWKRDNDALAFTNGSRLAGIYLLSADCALDASRRCPHNCTTLEGLDAWLVSKCFVPCEPVQDEQWQRVLTSEDRLSAERKLEGWLVKPTDGIFARNNRRVSIPISRWAIRYPITPNMVSLFTLGVSLLSGIYFGLGGYWNMLFGALLSVFASILDGCDGEVARMKLQESDFGCWLDTLCDHLYYIFVFAGMIIGLAKGDGMRVYLVWGGLLFVGVIASLLTTALQRRRLAGARPEQYLKIWQARASSQSSNPFLYLGRHTEFIIRRCFLPYLFLFFAVFNIMKVVLILAALGSNVVWPIALYSYCSFGSGRMSPARPVVSA